MKEISTVVVSRLESLHLHQHWRIECPGWKACTCISIGELNVPAGKPGSTCV